MKTVIKKLGSERGASILLALLFFLVCSMVAASILMAAVSNAGKIRSSREEQQAYLTLTSAMQFVCDDLLGATYYGRYTYELQQPAEGGWSKTYTQNKGSYECYLSTVLLDDFDYLFAEKAASQMTDFDTKNAQFVHQFIKRTDSSYTNGKHELTICPEGEEWKDQEVKLTLEVLDSYSIELKAELGEEGTARHYVIYAELTANVTDPPMLQETPPSQTPVNQSNGMTWKLGWITKNDDKREDAA